MKGFLPNLNPKSYAFWLWPLGVGALFLGVPLIQYVHFELAFVLALIASFSGFSFALHGKSTAHPIRLILRLSASLLLLSAPVFIFTAISGCLDLQGIGFWLLYPFPSLWFSFALGTWVRKTFIRQAHWLGWILFFFIALLGFVAEFFSFPQIYFHNHLWGGWPGPIYDETLILDEKTFLFRFLTLCWGFFFWELSRNAEKGYSLLLWISAAGLLVGYSMMMRTGIVLPDALREQKLGAVYHTEHFKMVYSPKHLSLHELSFWAERHEFFHHEIQPFLPERSTGKIVSYLYAHPWQKQKLTGAKYISYVPVWLNHDQLHIDTYSLDGVLKHELVHVLAKPYGQWPLNAHWHIGFTEGIAVAIAGGQSRAGTLDQLVAALPEKPDGKELQSIFSFSGFYGGRGPTNYTISGSFIHYLLGKYPIEHFWEVYGGTPLNKAYNKSWDALASEWHAHLETVQQDSLSQRASRQIFARPSLFEQKCPHHLPKPLEVYDRFSQRLADYDTLNALSIAKPLLESNDQRLFPYVLEVLETALDAEMLALYSESDISENWQGIFKLRQADMRLLQTGRIEKPELIATTDSLINRWMVQADQLRSDSLQWKKALYLRYRPLRFWQELGTTASTQEKLRLLGQLIAKEEFETLLAVCETLALSTIEARDVAIILPLLPRLIHALPTEIMRPLLYRLSEVAQRTKQHEDIFEADRYLKWREARLSLQNGRQDD